MKSEYKKTVKKTAKKAPQNKTKVLEKDIENACLEYLFLQSYGTFWKNESTGVYDTNRKTFRKKVNRFSINGVSDVLGVLKNGKFVAIEIKTPQRRNNVSAPQQDFINMVTGNNGYAFVVTSVQELETYMKRILREERL